jgi:hypothetical protein
VNHTDSGHIDELIHPIGTAGYIAAAARNLPPSDIWCILYPSVRTMLRSDILEMDEGSIMSALVSPVSGSVYTG